MSDEKIIQENKILGLIGSLEKSMEIKTFLLSAILAFSINISLAISNNISLTELTWEHIRISVPIGSIIVFFTGLTLYLSVFSNLAIFIADFIAIEIIHSKVFYHLFFRGRSDDDFEPPKYMVSPYDLLAAACEDENSEYLKKYKEYREIEYRIENEEKRISTLSLALIILIAIDTKISKSLSCKFIEFFNKFFVNLGSLIGILTIFLLFFLWIHRLTEVKTSNKWLYEPYLYKKIKMKNK